MKAVILIILGCFPNWIYTSSTPLLLVSMDGMRADKFDDFLRENPSCNFSRIVNNGLKADYMIPSFPSQTLPNHWTLVTGVYPETHGIVGNDIYDPVANIKIGLQNDANANNIQWWNRTDPIWLTARSKGLKTASSFWTGSEVWTRNPDIFLKFEKSWSFTSRIDELVNWFVKFNLDFACIYFPWPDEAGHTYGPDSQEYKDQIQKMDMFIGYLLDSLANANLLDNMNVIMLSDHGMGNSLSRPLLVTNYVDSSLIDLNRSVFSYASNIYPKEMSKLSNLYDALQNLSNSSIYYKSDVPERFHYSNSDRIGPIVAIADEGFVHTSDPNYKVKQGLHGYDNSKPTVRAIFTAFGPSFKQNQTMGPFENVNVQPLMCKLLSLESNQSNGTAEIFQPYLI